MEDVVRTHPLAAVVVVDRLTEGVAERLLPVEVAALHHAFVDQHVVEDDLAPAAGCLVLALEGRGQVVGLGADAGGLLLEVLDGLLHRFFQLRGAFRLGFLLGVEGLLHRLDVLAQVAGQALEGLLGLLADGLLALLEELLRLGGHLRADGLYLLLERSVVGFAQLLQGRLAGLPLLPQRGLAGLALLLERRFAGRAQLLQGLLPRLGLAPAERLHGVHLPRLADQQECQHQDDQRRQAHDDV